MIVYTRPYHPILSFLITVFAVVLVIALVWPWLLVVAGVGLVWQGGRLLRGKVPQTTYEPRHRAT